MGMMNRIGTPLSNSATRVMLPCCDELGNGAIIALQRLGCEVIGVVKRRMGVAVASADTTDDARTHAKPAASRVKPVKE